MRYTFQKAGPSRSFPEGDAFLQGQTNADTAEVIIYSGAPFKSDPRKAAILIEPRDECLGEHVDDRDPNCANVLGFARYRNGDDSPSKLIELVRHGNISETAVSAARELFSTAGLEVVVCSDQAGRIVSRLVVEVQCRAAFPR